MVSTPATLASHRARGLLRDLSDKPFIAMVFPDNGDVKIYMAGLSPDKMDAIQQFVEEIVGSGE